jgi:hypothetical protein
MTSTSRSSVEVSHNGHTQSGKTKLKRQSKGGVKHTRLDNTPYNHNERESLDAEFSKLVAERQPPALSDQEKKRLARGVAEYRERKSSIQSKDEQIVELLANGAWVEISRIAELLDSETTDPNTLASIRLSQLSKKLNDLGLTIERESHYRLVPSSKSNRRKS